MENINRNSLVAEIIKCLISRLEQHKEFGLENVIEQWNEQDYFYDKPVRLVTGENETYGICKGINGQGALLLEIDNVIKTIYGGEVSLRGAK